jgi:hypothetical protein
MVKSKRSKPDRDISAVHPNAAAPRLSPGSCRPDPLYLECLPQFMREQISLPITRN